MRLFFQYADVLDSVEAEGPAIDPLTRSDAAPAGHRRRGQEEGRSRAFDEGGRQGVPLRSPRRVRDPLRALFPHRLYPLQGSRKHPHRTPRFFPPCTFRTHVQ
jgi:hypothetical protein